MDKKYLCTILSMNGQIKEVIYAERERERDSSIYIKEAYLLFKNVSELFKIFKEGGFNLGGDLNE